MTAESLAERLGARRVGSGWLAPCRAHEDRTPSLSIGVGADGRILLYCFAGCSFRAILAACGLEPADLGPASPKLPRRPASSAELPPVLTWLHDVRRIPPEEAVRILAAETRSGPAVVFPYVDQTGRHVYDKYRLIREKRFWRQPKGGTAVLYGLPWIEPGPITIVEGELDAHALRAVGVRSVVSLPDGAKARLTDALLAPLASATEILIATDNDEQGEQAAQRLAQCLGVARCKRVLFTWEAGKVKDPNEALILGWPPEAFAKTIANARPMSQASATDERAPGVTAEMEPYRAVGGRLFHLVTDREGNFSERPLTNFDARIMEEVVFDDGAEPTRSFAIEGRTSEGEPLRRVRVGAAEFTSMAWVPRDWGSAAVVLAGQGTKDHARTAIQLLSRPRHRVVYQHTGWREVAQGQWAYLFHGGAVGAENVAVDLPPPLDLFVMPACPDRDRLCSAVQQSIGLLDCGPATLLIALLAATYAAPLASHMVPDFSLWLYGPTGSFKSELAALAQAHFGRFERKTLPASWSSTENALEARLFALKDALVVIDDYAPAADLRSQQDQVRRAQRVLRNVGNHAARGRLRQDLTQRPERPPRAIVVCTGEDLPPGASILARLLTLEVERDAIDRCVLTRLQESREAFAVAMRGYIEWLRVRWVELSALPARVSAVRDQIRPGAAHRRQPEAVAHLPVAFDYLMAFAEEVGAVLPAEAQRRRAQAAEALTAVAERQASLLRAANPADAFVSVLRTLIVQGTALLLPKHEDRSRGGSGVDVIGWQDEECVYLLPEAARRAVAAFMRDSGDAWSYTPTTLHRALVSAGVVVPGPDGRPETQARVGGQKRRVLKMPAERLRLEEGPEIPSPLSPSTDMSPAWERQT